MAEPDFLLFASDAELAAFWGGLFLLIALICMLMERRRYRRREINRVGWMPWTGLFLVFAAHVRAELQFQCFDCTRLRCNPAS